MATSRQYLITEPVTLDYQIPWHKIPQRPPRSQQKRLSKRQGFWRKQALVLNMVAQGFSLESEIKPILARKTDSSLKSISRAIKSLNESGILYRSTITLCLGADVYDLTSGSRGKITYALLRLTRRGRGLCRWLAIYMDEDWRPHETQWERMRRIHEQGKREPEHTLGTLVFAYQARQEGWSAGVMPGFQEGRFVPDVVVEKEGEKIFVEVEFHYDKLAKWQNMYNALGYIAFCGRSPQHEETLLKECMEIGEPVFSTNLTDLIIGEKKLWG